MRLPPVPAERRGACGPGVLSSGAAVGRAGFVTLVRRSRKRAVFIRERGACPQGVDVRIPHVQCALSQSHTCDDAIRQGGPTLGDGRCICRSEHGLQLVARLATLVACGESTCGRCPVPFAALPAVGLHYYVPLHEAPAPLVGNHHRADHAPGDADRERGDVRHADNGQHER